MSQRHRQTFQRVREKRALIRQKPTNLSWVYEMQIEDPDGNVIRFGSDSKKKIRFGTWQDMNGRK